MSLETVGAINPWSNAAEKEIKELKRGTGHKLLWSGAPKCFWYNCLMFKAYIRSNIANEICKLDGEVPETVKSGEP